MHRQMRLRKRGSALGAMVVRLSLLAAGCGGDDDDDEPSGRWQRGPRRR